MPYRVELDLFTGPLDLLLYLARRQELDIRNLSVAAVTRQFMEFLDVLTVLDLDLVGDFVVMASTLAEIKSRMVLPQDEADEPPSEPLAADDARSELVHQLLEYKRFKDAAVALEERAAEWQRRYPRLSDDRPGRGRNPAADRIKEVELWDLVSALSRVLQKKVIEEHASIRYDDTPIQVYVDQIAAAVHREGQVQFTSLFDAETSRSKIVGLFLAVLELLRHHSYRAEQAVPFGEIMILPPLES